MALRTRSFEASTAGCCCEDLLWREGLLWEGTDDMLLPGKNAYQQRHQLMISVIAPIEFIAITCSDDCNAN